MNINNENVVKKIVSVMQAMKHKKVIKAAMKLLLPSNIEGAISVMLDEDDFKGIENKLSRSIEEQRELTQKLDSINDLLEGLLYRNKGLLKPIIAVGGANAEVILESYEPTDLNLGEKYTVAQHNHIGGSAVNFSSWLLDNKKFVIPVLVVGADQVGRNIRESLLEKADKDKFGLLIDRFLTSPAFFHEDIRTPVSTILLHNHQRTIFKQKLEGVEHIHSHIAYQTKAIGDLFDQEIGSILIGHIESDASHFENINNGEPKTTLFLINEARKKYKCFVYAVFGKSQYEYGCDYWESYLGSIDILQLNIRESKVFFQRANRSTKLEDMIEWFRKQNIAVILTMDQFGAIGINGISEKIYHVWPLLSSDSVKDPTGAGDAFAAGMLSILSQKNSISYENFGRAMAEGNIWAACACQMLGGTGTAIANPVSALRHKLGARCEDEIEKMDIGHAKKIIRFIDLAYQN